MTSEYYGMSVNERLFAADLMDSFAEACAASNVAALRHLLRSVEMPEADIEAFIAGFPQTDGNSE
ncbi:hypothetical protein [Kordiimonas marina]|uniref:hypothetical protein n=1 Tax=Kordiimonas marina TaxID=2872312 RepID=UPI001FF3F1F2|nr:hypothetical protein [Kordiimonas marina]MCJ9427840.1 hypothetical protein [Kordiimonas marina]